MATRQCEFIAKAVGETVSLNISFNNAEVYNGVVPSTIKDENFIQFGHELGTLLEFNVDESISGIIPLSITVTGGDLLFGDIYATYREWKSIEGGGEKIVMGSEMWPVNDNTLESDGKESIQYTGEDNPVEHKVRDSSVGMGDWHYMIADGNTFNCMFEFLPDRVLIE